MRKEEEDIRPDDVPAKPAEFWKDIRNVLAVIDLMYMGEDPSKKIVS